MTIRNLEYCFNPKSVALVGASERPSSIGSVLARNLLEGGFDGEVLFVNPKHESLHGMRAYRDVNALPVAPELAVIATPPDSVPGIITALAKRGTRAAVVITAGFGDTGEPRGEALQRALLESARPALLRIIGPNCVGVLAPGVGLNASFSHIPSRPGRLAFVAQSGAVVTSVLDWADARGIGFSHLVSLGDMADVDFGDMLDYLANDPGTDAVLLYVEAITHARKFMSAARAAARMKPVIVVKAGRHAEGARAAASHTGALAGSDAVYDAAFRRAGMLRVFTLEELFDAVEILAMSRPPEGERLAILSNGGGMGVLATDALMDHDGRLATLSPQTLERLDAVLPATWSHDNPVDIIGDAPASRYSQSLEALLADTDVDAVLVMNCPTAVASSTDAAQAVIDTYGTRERPCLITSWVGDSAAREARRRFGANRIPTYGTPAQAVRGFSYLVNHQRSQRLLMETPPSIPESFTVDLKRARAPIERARHSGRVWLTEPEAKEVLAAYGIPVPETFTALTPDEAALRADLIEGPVVLKILSPEITHKSDVGGVVLDLNGAAAVRDAAAAMLDRAASARPDANIEGFTVQPMVRRDFARELIVGMTVDAQFGPVILFGQGGTAVEVIDDSALALPPLNVRLAHELVGRTRMIKLLQGYRDVPGADMDAIILTLIKVSQLIVDIPQIAELDINPLLADPDGVLALDARIRVADAAGIGSDRLAIRPYPKELEENIELGDGRRLLLRPIRPEDEPALQAGFSKLTPEEVRLRFFVPMRALTHVMAARFTQIDYDREMALVLAEPGIAGQADIYGVVRIHADPDNERAEYAIILGLEMTGMGLGYLMMKRIIHYARARGIGEVFGDVLRENNTMLRLCGALGFAQAATEDEPGLMRVTLPLSKP